MARPIRSWLSRTIAGPAPYVLQEWETREDGEVTGTIHSVHDNEENRRKFVNEVARRRHPSEPGTGAFPLGDAVVSEQPYVLILSQQGDSLYTYGRWVNLS